VRYAVYIPTMDRRVGGMRPTADLLTDIERVERAGYESAWIMDHILIDRDGGRGSGHDPFPVLAAAAARTTRVGLGTLVLGDPFRPIWQTAREAAALADLSGGRFLLGMGAGWHQPEFDAFGIPFTRLVSRFEERLPALRSLLQGEAVTRDGALALRDARIYATAAPPPIWVAGSGPRMLRLTARCADGWNIAWGNADPGWMTETLATLRRELDAAGRDPATFTTSAGVMLGPGSTDRDIAELAAAYEAIGLDLLILHFADRAGGQAYDEGIEHAARVVGIGS
jgi:alkanesulfonate monooxygenase SsuD/methylene tetrahydromethanopterin reductase-like flavin-dependent oxidoreductase (luciferase family)